MAVQPARWASAGLRPIGTTPRIRQTRPRATRPSSASPRVAAAVVARPAVAHATARPATATVRVVAPPIPKLAADWQPWGRFRPSATLLGLIIVGTMLGLVYLTQLLDAQSARYEVDRLMSERRMLVQNLTSQAGTIAQWGSEAQVVQWAQGQGYDDLGQPIRLKGR
ncbi:MAG: hypothetical protein U0869_09250 [Chloroflexota bacterium]